MATVVATMTVFESYLKIAFKSSEKTYSALLAEEGAEIIQVLRDNGFGQNIAPLAVSTAYYLYWNGTSFGATTTPQIINEQYLRTIQFENIYRDANSDIAETGTLDENTKKVSITVSKTSATNTPIFYTESLIHNTYEN